MAYAAYANIDPRLLAEDRGNNAEAITAIGKGIKDTIDNIDKEKEKEKKEQKAKEDRAFIDFQRRELVQASHDKWREAMTDWEKYGIGDKPGEWQAPVGWKIENKIALKDGEITNAVNTIKQMTEKQILRRNKRNKKRHSKGKDPLSYRSGDTDVIDEAGNTIVNYSENDVVTKVVEGNIPEEKQVEYSPIIMELREQNPDGMYGENTFESGDDAKESLKIRKGMEGKKNQLIQSVLQLTGKPNFDPVANPYIQSLAVASEQGKLEVVRRGSDGVMQYTWYDPKAKKYRFLNNDGLWNVGGQVNQKYLNEGQDIKNVVDVDSMQTLILENGNGKTILNNLANAD